MMVATQDASGLQYLLTDHLGSTVAVTNSSGTLTSQQRYLPFGGTRAIPNSPILGTDFGYTGQRLLDSGMGGIMDYRARFYSPALMRFLQPDTIIPDQFNPQSWNRFSYVENDPINYSDVSGHFKCKNDSTTFEGDCAAVIEAYLTMLQEKGGEEGQALVKAFREKDSGLVCAQRCHQVKDAISIVIVDAIPDKNGKPTDALAQSQTGLLGGQTYLVTAGMMNATGEDQLVMAGSFGHEIVHQTQTWYRNGTLLAELEAYDVQATLYANMGISSSSNSNVSFAQYVTSYKYKSEDEIVSSDWARKNYPGMPFTNQFTPPWIPSTPPTIPRPVIPKLRPI